MAEVETRDFRVALCSPGMQQVLPDVFTAIDEQDALEQAGKTVDLSEDQELRVVTVEEAAAAGAVGEGE